MAVDAACVKCPEPENAIVHVDCVTHRYPDGTEGIHNMCFRVYPKEIVALCGPNGAGKSTLIEHINGLMMPDVGRVKVFDKEIDKGNVASIRRLVGLVFQNADSQLFSPTVLDDVMFGPLNLGMSPQEARDRAEWALNIVGMKEINKIPHYLSGGQKRLVAIAGVLAMQPRILVADEPTGDLDPSNSKRIEQLLRSLRDEHGMSVVVAMHDMDMAARLADRICVVKNGSIMAEGRPEDVLYDEDLLISAGLQLPTVARLYKEFGLDAGTDRKPLTLDEVVSMVNSKATKKKAKPKENRK